MSRCAGELTCPLSSPHKAPHRPSSGARERVLGIHGTEGEGKGRGKERGREERGRGGGRGGDIEGWGEREGGGERGRQRSGSEGVW